ncbi:hypothetical protein [Bradyrhizobium genosp. P]|uniref:hypothetical protein n=1 Tax=Bradyrhizobium genosp. P TaxID=83641 RepID=UPI003CFAD67A
MCASLNVVEPQARSTIAAISDAILAHAQVYRLLKCLEGDAMIDATIYMENLCLATSRSKLADCAST